MKHYSDDDPNFMMGHDHVHFPHFMHFPVIFAVPFRLIEWFEHCPTHIPHPVHKRARRIDFSARPIRCLTLSSSRARATTVHLRKRAQFHYHSGQE